MDQKEAIENWKSAYNAAFAAHLKVTAWNDQLLAKPLATVTCQDMETRERLREEFLRLSALNGKATEALWKSGYRNGQPGFDPYVDSVMSAATERLRKLTE